MLKDNSKSHDRHLTNQVSQNLRYHQVVERNILSAFERAVNFHIVCLHACDTSGYDSVVGAVGNIFQHSGVGDESSLLMTGNHSETRLHSRSQ